MIQIDFMLIELVTEYANRVHNLSWMGLDHIVNLKKKKKKLFIYNTYHCNNENALKLKYESFTIHIALLLYRLQTSNILDNFKTKLKRISRYLPSNKISNMI